MIEIIITRYNNTLQEIDSLKRDLNFIYQYRLLSQMLEHDFQAIAAIHAKIVRLELIAERLSTQF